MTSGILVFYGIPREHCITNLYHAIKNTVASTVNVTYAWSTMARLDHFHANQSHFHKNGFTLRLALKQRHKGTLKWPIKVT